MKNLQSKYNEILPINIKKALELCSEVADKNAIPIFLIGGVVRDMIMGQKSFDTDITVQSNAIKFSRLLSSTLPNCKVIEEHEDFKTAKIEIEIENEKIALDIASTRKEVYETPASLPVVTKIGCNIKDDLIRRDFTVNAMALSLNKESFCNLTDPLNGYKDLQQGLIRIIHEQSFIDDPTRIVRALKFAVRFNFELEENTKNLQKKCIESGQFDSMGSERLKSEIKQTFSLEGEILYNALEKFANNKIYKLVNSNISKFPETKQITDIIDKYSEFIEHKEFLWLLYLSGFLLKLETDEITKTAQKLNLSGFETIIAVSAKELMLKEDKLFEAKQPFEIYELLQKYLPESIIMAFACLEKSEKTTTIQKNIELYLSKLKNVKINSTGKDLLEMGICPGPVFGTILKQLLKAKINGEISSQQDESELLKKIT